MKRSFSAKANNNKTTFSGMASNIYDFLISLIENKHIESYDQINSVKETFLVKYGTNK